MRWLILGALFTSGCYSEFDFIPEKTDAFCDYMLECSEPAVIEFDGMTMEVCQGLWGPRFQAEGESCRKFKRSLAKTCVAELQVAVCPTDGSPVEYNIPEVCAFVYERCDTLDPTPELPVED